jgi:hypothetical protein
MARRKFLGRPHVLEAAGWRGRRPSSAGRAPAGRPAGAGAWGPGMLLRMQGRAPPARGGRGGLRLCGRPVAGTVRSSGAALTRYGHSASKSPATSAGCATRVARAATPLPLPPLRPRCAGAAAMRRQRGAGLRVGRAGRIGNVQRARSSGYGDASKAEHIEGWGMSATLPIGLGGSAWSRSPARNSCTSSRSVLPLLPPPPPLSQGTAHHSCHSAAFYARKHAPAGEAGSLHGEGHPRALLMFVFFPDFNLPF